MHYQASKGACPKAHRLLYRISHCGAQVLLMVQVIFFVLIYNTDIRMIVYYSMLVNLELTGICLRRM
jgi:hypothetical protein